MFNPEIEENGIIVNKRIAIHTGTSHVYFAARDKVMITQNINEHGITNGMIGLVESININGRYDMKRAQVEFGADEDDDSPIDLDPENIGDSIDEIMGVEKEEKKKNENEEDQRQSSHVMRIKFVSGQTFECSTAGDYRKVNFGYAATCHKSQGGEYPSVIILCHSVNSKLLTREWLYTAVTRARENVYIICNSRGLDQALSRQNIKGKTLKEKIASYIIETKIDEEGNDFLDKSTYPILWEPEAV
jgi:ATP-dependent exoDNAse (exonuclease V) alpha subunit